MLASKQLALGLDFFLNWKLVTVNRSDGTKCMLRFQKSFVCLLMCKMIWIAQVKVDLG